MRSTPGGAGQAPARRTDARRSRERILQAARAAFADPVAEVSVAEIAWRSGVGSATHPRKRPAGCEFSRWRAVSSLSQCVSPCIAVGRCVAVSTDKWRTASVGWERCEGPPALRGRPRTGGQGRTGHGQDRRFARLDDAVLALVAAKDLAVHPRWRVRGPDLTGRPKRSVRAQTGEPRMAPRSGAVRVESCHPSQFRGPRRASERWPGPRCPRYFRRVSHGALCHGSIPHFPVADARRMPAPARLAEIHDPCRPGR